MVPRMPRKVGGIGPEAGLGMEVKRGRVQRHQESAVWRGFGEAPSRDPNQ